MNAKHPFTIHRRSFVGIAGLALMGATIGARAWAQSAATERKTLKLVSVVGYTQQPIAWGIEKGYFDEQGLEVEFIGAQDVVTAVATGEVDFAFGPSSTYLRAASLGSPIRIVAAGFRSKGPFHLIARPEIKTVADLKGKTVGIAVAGSGMAIYAREILKAHGIDPDKDVTLVANGVYEAAFGSLQTGQVDATIIHQPFPALGEIEGSSHTLARGWDYLPTYHTGVLIAGSALIDRDPDLLTRGLRAYFKSYTEAKANYADYVPWLKSRLKINPEAVQRAIDQEDEIWDANPAVDPFAIAETQKIEVANGYQKEIFDDSKFLDLRFIPTEYVKPFSYPERKA